MHLLLQRMQLYGLKHTSWCRASPPARAAAAAAAVNSSCWAALELLVYLLLQLYRQFFQGAAVLELLLLLYCLYGPLQLASQSTFERFDVILLVLLLLQAPCRLRGPFGCLGSSGGQQKQRSPCFAAWP